MAYETPSGTVNGVNATFTTASQITNEQIVVDRLVQISGADYTVSGNTIVFQPGSIPQTGATIRIWYGALPATNGGATATITVAELIEGAFRLLGVLAAEESPSGAEQSNALEALSDMVDSWANERLALFATVRSTYTLTAGHNPHTIGSGGDFNTTRPVRVDRASLVLSSSPNAELPLAVLSDAGWQATQGKTTPGTPVYLWIETAYPLANLWLNPVPVYADSLVLYTWQQLGRFAATSDMVDLPPGYARALRFNLAKELAPEYGIALSAEAADIANESKTILKRLNTKPGYLRSDQALLRRAPFNVVSGDRG